MTSSSICISALVIAKLLASQTTLNGLFASGKAKTGASTSDCLTEVKLFTWSLDQCHSASFQEIRDWFGSLCLILAVFVQVSSKITRLTQILHMLWDWTFFNRLYLISICSDTVLLQSSPIGSSLRVTPLLPLTPKRIQSWQSTAPRNFAASLAIPTAFLTPALLPRMLILLYSYQQHSQRS